MKRIILKEVVAYEYRGKFIYTLIHNAQAGRKNVYTVVAGHVDDPVTIGQEIPLSEVRELIAKYESVAPDCWMGEKGFIITAMEKLSVKRLKENKYIAKFQTNGRGDWGTVKLTIPIFSIERLDHELRVYFDTETWNVSKHGLIYTDPLFLKQLKVHLKAERWSYWNKVDYSEHGIQGSDYVSFDI